MTYGNAICLKDFTANGLVLEKDKTYTIRLYDEGTLVIFTKHGWFGVKEWEDTLRILKD